MTVTSEVEPTTARRSVARQPHALLLALAAGIVIAVGVALRLRSASGLWLDEAQSVAIARLPLSQLTSALRQDGSPPLYYLLLHFWISLFGTGTESVRALSVVLGGLTIPAGFLAGRAVGGARVGWFTAVFVAASPFAIRYATETRMYALLTLLAMVGVVVLVRAERNPSVRNLMAVALVSGLLALTHYWALFLLGAVALWLVARMLLGRGRRTALRELVALVAGGVLFLPWVPSFFFQMRHTGTPWAGPPGWGAVLPVVRSWGGVGRHVDAAEPIYVITILLVVIAVFARDSGRRMLMLGRPDARAIALLVAAVGSVLVGVAVSRQLGSGFLVRYTAGALAPMLVLMAFGAARLPRLIAGTLVGTVAVLGLSTSADAPFTTFRTQAVPTAATLRAGLQPGDGVVYCPDQLGPAVSRLLPTSVRQYTYPSLSAPQRIDWVDYNDHVKSANPLLVAAELARRVPGAVWLVSQSGYRPFGSQCAQLDQALTARMCTRTVLQLADGRYYERESVTRYDPCP